MNLDEVRCLLGINLRDIESRVAAACRLSGRPRDAVTLVAVTKYASAAVTALLPEFEIFDLGESRPQVLWDKAAALPTSVRWHMVGHLQRNKIDKTLPFVNRLHSVDSVRLLEAVAEWGRKAGRRPRVFLEVNASHEEQKHGFGPAELPNLLPELLRLSADVEIGGLMTMAAKAGGDGESARPAFAELRRVRDRLQSEAGAALTLTHLSMGMTQDYEVAVEEGATLIRVGSAIFDGIDLGNIT